MPNTTYCNLTKLKHRLNIQPINTSRQFSLGGSGIVSDDMDALHAMRSISGDCINLMSGVEFSFTEWWPNAGVRGLLFQFRQNQPRA